MEEPKMTRTSLVAVSIAGLALAAIALFTPHAAMSQTAPLPKSLRPAATMTYTPVGAAIGNDNVSVAWFVVVTDTDLYPVSCHTAVQTKPTAISCARGTFPTP
jgi:hypothetical protein